MAAPVFPAGPSDLARPHPQSVLGGRINLAPTARPRNLFAFFLGAAATVGTAILFNSFLPLLLKVINVSTEEQGHVTGLLNVVGECAEFPAVILFGTWSDKVGRRTVFALGMFLLSASMALAAASRALAFLYCVRILYGVGMAGCTGTCLLRVQGKREQARAQGKREHSLS